MKKVLIVAGIALALTAGAATASSDLPWKFLGSFGPIQVYKVCDSGRAIYMSEAYASLGGITVVENAAECRFQ